MTESRLYTLEGSNRFAMFWFWHIVCSFELRKCKLHHASRQFVVSDETLNSEIRKTCSEVVCAIFRMPHKEIASFNRALRPGCRLLLLLLLLLLLQRFNSREIAKAFGRGGWPRWKRWRLPKRNANWSVRQRQRPSCAPRLSTSLHRRGFVPRVGQEVVQHHPMARRPR